MIILLDSLSTNILKGFLMIMIMYIIIHIQNTVLINSVFLLFRVISPGEEILYDYGVKNLPWQKGTFKFSVRPTS